METKGFYGNRTGKWTILPVVIFLLLLLSACGAGSPAEDNNAAEAGVPVEESSGMLQTDPYGSGYAPAAYSQAATGPVAESAAPVQESEETAVTAAQEPAGQNAQADQPNPAAENSGGSTTARLSFANYSYVDSGDESIPKMIRNVEIPVQTADNSQEALLCGIVDTLRRIPQGLAGAETMVSGLYRINSITIDHDTAVVDVAGGAMANASPFDEEFFVYQVADSILHSDPAIRKVRFTVDGSREQGFLYVDMNRDYDAGACDAFCG